MEGTSDNQETAATTYPQATHDADSSHIVTPVGTMEDCEDVIARAVLLAAQTDAAVAKVLADTSLGPTRQESAGQLMEDITGPPAPAVLRDSNDGMDISQELLATATLERPTQATINPDDKEREQLIEEGAVSSVGQKRQGDTNLPGLPAPKLAARSGPAHVPLFAGYESPAKLKQAAEAFVAPDLIPATRVPENINTLRGPGGRFASKTPKPETGDIEMKKRRRKRTSMKNGNQWTEEENLLFLQGLQTFGRKFSRIHSRFFPYRTKQAVVCRFSYLSRVWADCRDTSVLAQGHPLRDAYLKILPPMETHNFIQRRKENEERLAMGLPLPAKVSEIPLDSPAKEPKPPREKKQKESTKKRRKKKKKKKIEEEIEELPPRRTSSGRLRKRPARLLDHADSDFSDDVIDDDDDENFQIADGAHSETDSDSDCFSPGRDPLDSPLRQSVEVPLIVAQALEKKMMNRPSLTDSTEDADVEDEEMLEAGAVVKPAAPSAEDIAIAEVLAAPTGVMTVSSAESILQADAEATATLAGLSAPKQDVAESVKPVVIGPTYTLSNVQNIEMITPQQKQVSAEAQATASAVPSTVVTTVSTVAIPATEAYQELQDGDSGTLSVTVASATPSYLDKVDQPAAAGTQPSASGNGHTQ